MTINYKAPDAEATESAGRELAGTLWESGIRRAFVALFGEMGVGKTAFCRGFAGYFGIKNIKSPTYTVLNEHRGLAAVHHFDFYRITDGDDLYSIGYDDIVESDGFCLGEWSENIVDYLPPDTVSVKISKTDFQTEGEGAREIEIDFGSLSDKISR